MKHLIKEYAELKIKAEKLEGQLNAAIEINIELEKALDNSINKLDLILQSHKVTTQIFSHTG